MPAHVALIRQGFRMPGRREESRRGTLRACATKAKGRGSQDRDLRYELCRVAGMLVPIFISPVTYI